MLTDHFSATLSERDFEMIRCVPPGGNWKDIPHSIPSKRLEQIRAKSAAGGGSRSTYYGRLRWNRPAYTVSTYFNRPGNGCYIHPIENRLISIREAARLQSFPDSFKFYGAFRRRCSQVGNAVPPLLAYSIARVLPQGRFVDAFCGVGGLSLGFDWNGSECVAAVDRDPVCVDTYSRNRTGKQAGAVSADLSDIIEYRKVISHVKSALGGAPLDLLVGGPPCQGFSTAGNNRFEDPRNLLVWSFVQMVNDLAPRIVVMENVPALAWRRSASILNDISCRLGLLGYSISIVIAHAETYGVPQSRRRLFLLASKEPRDLRLPTPSFQVVEPAYRRHQPGVCDGLPFPPTVQDAIADLPRETVQHIDISIEYEARASSLFSQWSRGEIGLDKLAPLVGVQNLPSISQFASGLAIGESE